MKDLFLYFHDGTMSDDPMEKEKLRKKAAKYCILDGRLYKRGFSHPLLKCLSQEEAQTVLRECHKGIRGNHPGTKVLSQVVLSVGYYWPTLEADAKTLVNVCEQCQKFSPTNLRPDKEIMPIMAPYPFAQWGIDIVGEIKKSTQQ